MKYTYFASDILEAAMELAQSKSLNSYSFRDCMNWMTELWQNCYERIAQIDDGYYSKTVRLTERLTHLPPFVRNTIKVYAARDQLDAPRRIYRASSMSDLTSYGTYHISGFDLYCPDATSRIMWLEYTPEPPFITYTKNNRDPRVLQPPAPIPPALPQRYGGFQITESFGPHRYTATSLYDPTVSIDITTILERPDQTIISLIFDSPYVFVSYSDDKTGDWSSWIMKDIFEHTDRVFFNPFDFLGRPSRVKYCSVKWNDYTGMGCIVEDQETNRILELGWTPDTVMFYPSPIMRNYLVANMAKKFADLNGAQVMAVESEVVSAQYQIANFLARDKSAWFRMDRVVGPTMGDLL